MSKPRLFSMVKCCAYLKPVRDGVNIMFLSPEEIRNLFGSKEMEKYPYGKAIAHTAEGEKDLSSFEGDSVEKTYRVRMEKQFKGYVVGYTTVKVKGIIGTDSYSNDYEEGVYFFKNTTERVEAAIVFYGNNRKRYVLLDDIEEEKS